MKISRAFLLRWHRRAGLAAALFLLVVITTGVTLNHARLFGMDQIKADAPWLLSLYGMEMPDSYVLGAVMAEGMAVVATQEGVSLFTAEGELIERVQQPSLPPGKITQITAGREAAVILLTDQGTYGCDANFISCAQTGETGSGDSAMPDVIRAAVERQYNGGGISLEKLVLDIHTWRFFGPLGAFFTDLVALAVFILIASGVYNGIRRR